MEAAFALLVLLLVLGMPILLVRHVRQHRNRLKREREEANKPFAGIRVKLFGSLYAEDLEREIRGWQDDNPQLETVNVEFRPMPRRESRWPFNAMVTYRWRGSRSKGVGSKSDIAER